MPVVLIHLVGTTFTDCAGLFIHQRLIAVKGVNINMRVRELLEALNPNVTFEYQDDIEGDKNRGWQVDQVKAFLDGKQVGYLKMSYIPQERFDAYYHDI